MDSSLPKSKACDFNSFSVFPFCKNKATSMVIWGIYPIGFLEDLCTLVNAGPPCISAWPQGISPMGMWVSLMSHLEVSSEHPPLLCCYHCCYWHGYFYVYWLSLLSPGSSVISIALLHTRLTLWMSRNTTSGYHRGHTALLLLLLGTAAASAENPSLWALPILSSTQAFFCWDNRGFQFH